MTTRSREQDDSLIPYTADGVRDLPWYRYLETGEWHYWHPGNPYPWYPFPSRIFLMDDVIGRPGLYNPVNHFVLDAFISGGLPDWHTSDGHTGHPVDPDFLVLPHRIGVDDRVRDWPWLPVPSAAQLSDWSIEAFNKFHDQVPTTVSLANFMYELKDMKGMIPTINRKSLSKTASNNFLAFEFGVKPFISDVKAIVAMSDSVTKRIQHLLETQGKTTNLSFVRENLLRDEQFSFVRSIANPYDTLYGNDHGFDLVRFTRLGGKSVFRVEAKLTQDLRDLATASSQMKGLIASGGFNHPARVIWNAIPYSFVVDWFFSVGKLLDSLTIQPFGGEYEISNVGYSVKTEADYKVVVDYGTGNPIIGNSMLGTVRVRGYTRKEGFPATSLFLTDGSLSPTQLVLGLAMLEQKRR